MNSVRKELNFYKIVIFIALPVMLQQFITALGSLIDNLMVGQLSEPAIAAVGASSQIFMIVMSLGYGISEGVSIFIAQQYGAKKFNKMHYSFCVGIIFSVLIGVVSMLIVYLFKVPILELFSLEKDGINYGVDYLNIVVISYFFVLLNITLGTAFRATSRTRIPMVAGIISIILNTSLNYLFINGNLGFPALGVTGAALATTFSKTVEFALLLFFMFYYKPEFLPKLKDFINIPVDLMRNITFKSIPLIINEGLWAGGKTILAMLYATRGESEFAAITIANTVANLLFVTMAGFAVSVSILIGQQLGKNHLHKAKRDTFRLLRLGLIVGIIITFIAFILAQIVPGLYNVSAETSLLATRILQITGLFFPVYIVTATVFFTLRAGGDAIGVFIMDSLSMMLISVPVAAYFTYFTDVNIIYLYLIVQMTEILKIFISFYRLGQYKWVTNLNKTS